MKLVNLHAVVLLVNSLQVLLELLKLSETVFCQFTILLQLTVHLLKLLSKKTKESCGLKGKQ